MEDSNSGPRFFVAGLIAIPFALIGGKIGGYFDKTSNKTFMIIGMISGAIAGGFIGQQASKKIFKPKMTA